MESRIGIETSRSETRSNAPRASVPFTALLVTSTLLADLEKAMAAWPVSVLVEAEASSNLGGWAVDPQFMDIMGSPYPLAYSLGWPVAGAVTTVELPGPRVSCIWMRTIAWLGILPAMLYTPYLLSRHRAEFWGPSPGQLLLIYLAFLLRRSLRVIVPLLLLEATSRDWVPEPLVPLYKKASEVLAAGLALEQSAKRRRGKTG
jgi:hypothetical protein